MGIALCAVVDFMVGDRKKKSGANRDFFPLYIGCGVLLPYGDRNLVTNRK